MLVIALSLTLIQVTSYSQGIVFKGLVKDEQSLKPIPEVNIRINGTTLGTATDHNGWFSVRIDTLPATLTFSCIGYQDERYDVSVSPGKRVEFLMRPKSYSLKEVNVTSTNYSFLFKNQDYSVLDYELMDDKVLLLVFRTLLKKSELILLNQVGDTVAVSSLPDIPPLRLYKDFLLNIHYFARSDYAYQVFFNKRYETLDVLYKTPVDSLEKIVSPFIFRISDRLYFQDSQSNGLGTTIGFYQKGTGKKIIRQYFNEKKANAIADDQVFYGKWNGLIASQIPPGDEEGLLSAAKFAQSPKLGQYMNKFDTRAYKFEFYNMIYPVIRISDSLIAFFNFGDDRLELLDKDGKTIKSIPINFHKDDHSKSDATGAINLSESGWRWGRMILTDQNNQNVYTTYHKNGMIRINRIDLTTGRLQKGTLIPLPFPEKMELYDGQAYFLNRGKDENWKLVKCQL